VINVDDFSLLDVEEGGRVEDDRVGDDIAGRPAGLPAALAHRDRQLAAAGAGHHSELLVFAQVHGGVGGGVAVADKVRRALLEEERHGSCGGRAVVRA
jgi:hypothetical protein